MDIHRDESFFDDSLITLELMDGTPVSFPVSSEQDRDERFFRAIQARVDRIRNSGTQRGTG